MLTHLSPYIPYKQNDYANAQKSDGKSKHYQYFRNKNGGEWGLNNQYTTAIILFEKTRAHTQQYQLRRLCWLKKQIKQILFHLLADRKLNYWKKLIKSKGEFHHSPYNFRLRKYGKRNDKVEGYSQLIGQQERNLQYYGYSDTKN